MKLFDLKLRRYVLLFVALVAVARTLAIPPPLREEVSLNGVWVRGGQVPLFGGESFTSKTYVRSVLVPSTWTGKTVRLEFNAVNYVADIYINGKKIQRHVGGWVPFTVLITKYIKAGSTFELKVIVHSRMSPPYVDANSKPLWPFGDLWTAGGDNMWSGITDDVWMRAYGIVNIYDTYIQTSLANKQLILTQTLFNKGTTRRTVLLGGFIVRASTGLIEKSLTPASITLAAGEKKIVKTFHAWINPELWWPDQPELYHLTSTIIENSDTIDSETRRFGFREIRTVGNQFYINGIRVNLRGDFVEYMQDYPAEKFSRESWALVIDDLKRLNINTFRHHKYPAPAFCYDLADEKGLFIINESAINGDAKQFYTGYNAPEYFANAKTWVSEWIKGFRNHPSVILWSAVNEMFFAGINSAGCTALANYIKAWDTTRPVIFCGEREKGQLLIDYHYPRPKGSTLKFNSEPYDWENGIYNWSVFINEKKPTCATECLNVPGRSAPVYTEQRNKWWHGIFTRGMRYVNWAIISPGEAYNWILKEADPNDIKIINYQNAFNPVALFDKDYDNLGLTPFVTGTIAGGVLPIVDEGALLNRTLVLYNDEFRDSAVTVKVEVKSGTTVYASGIKTYSLAPGEHLEIPYSFQVPYVAGNMMNLVLTTKKRGVQKFTESRTFSVLGHGIPGTSSTVVILGGGGINQAPFISITSPLPETSFSAPATINFEATASDSDGNIAHVDFYNGLGRLFTDTAAPYSYAWTNVQPGSYLLNAIAYDDMGLSTNSGSINVRVNEALSIANLVLIDADKDEVIQSLTNGSSISLSGHINIRANTSPPVAGSVIFSLSGAQTINHVESISPYDLFGNAGGTLTAGNYTLTATPYSSSGGSGFAGKALTIDFTIEPYSLISFKGSGRD